MTNCKHTKKALLLSLLSLLLCCSMLLGSTFAWFTDSVTSGNNKIVAGNLDVELEYWDGSAWQKVTETTKLFSELEADGKTENLWEPGHTEVVYLKVSNVGTLALKYQFSVVPGSETVFENVLGDKDCKLSDYLVFGQTKANPEAGEAYKTREDAWTAAGSTLGLSRYISSDELLKTGDAHYVALVVYMPTTVGNEANYRGDVVPSIELGIKLEATQTPYENDSFGPDYDKDAAAAILSWGDMADSELPVDPTDEKTILIETPEQLAALAARVNGGDDLKGYTVKLVNNVDLSGANWVPIGSGSNYFRGTFDGQGNTITGLTIQGDENTVALFGNLNGTVQNLKVTDAKVSGKDNVAIVVANVFNTGSIKDVDVTGAVLNGGHYVGTIVGRGWIHISDCDVSDVTITVEPYLDGEKYDNGDKVGGLVGFIGEGGSTVTNNTVTNATITAYRDVGGLAGYSYNDNTLSGNKVSNVDIIVSDKNGYGKTVQPAGEIVGNRELRDDELGNTTENVTITRTTATAEALLAAINSAKPGDTITLAAGSYTLPTAAQNKTLTIVGVEGTVINVNTAGNNMPDYSLQGATVTFENLTIKTNGGSYDGYMVDDATFNNCTIENHLCLYGNSNEFNDCTFNVSGDTYNVWTWGTSKVTFDGCTFNSDGKALMLYGGGTTQVTVNDCVFNDSEALEDGKAAIETGDDYGKANYTLVVNNTVVNGFAVNPKGTSTNSTLWANKNSIPTDRLSVTIDGVKVY